MSIEKLDLNVNNKKKSIKHLKLAKEIEQEKINKGYKFVLTGDRNNTRILKK